MSAKIIDISGKMIDESIKADLGILCRDIEVANSQGQQWSEIEYKLTAMLHQAMIVAGLNYFETENLVVTVMGDEIEIEGKGDVSCAPH